MIQSTDTTSMQEQIEEAITLFKKEFTKTRAGEIVWLRGIMPGELEESLRNKFVTIASKSAEVNINKPWVGIVVDGWFPTELNFRNKTEAVDWLKVEYKKMKNDSNRVKGDFGWKNKERTHFVAKVGVETNNEGGYEYDEIYVSYEIKPMEFYSTPKQHTTEEVSHE